MGALFDAAVSWSSRPGRFPVSGSSTTLGFPCQKDNLPALLALLARRLSAELGDACLLHVTLPGGRWLDTLACQDPDPAVRELLEGLQPGLHEALAGEGFFGGRAPVLLGHDRLAELLARGCPGSLPFVEAAGVSEALVVPLIADGRELGHATLLRHASGRAPYGPEDLALAGVLADWTALAIEDARLEAERGRQAARRARDQELAFTRLAALESGYRVLFGQSGDAVFETSPEGEIRAANPAACRLFGCPERELKRLGRAGLLADRDEQAGLAMTRERMGPGTVRHELRYRRKDGTSFTGATVSTVFQLPQGERRTLTIVRDVTRERQARDEVARLGAIVQHAFDAIASISATDLTVISWNQGAEELLGYSAAEVLGRPLHGLVPADWLGQLTELVASLARGEEVRVQASRQLHRDGTTVLASLSAFPVRDEAGLTTSYCLILRPSPGARRDDWQAAELKRARELNALKDHFLSTISHEIKTPLTLIEGYAELLQDRQPGDLMVAGILEGSRRLATHINRILAYSALASGAVPLERVVLDAHELVSSAAGLLTERIEASELAFALEIETGMAPLLVDPRWAVELLRELLDNATKFSPPGSTVAVTLREAGGRARLEVQGGAPISAADQSRIWQAFAQTEIGDARSQGGLGLGLAIVKLVVKLHGGTVGIEPAVAGGSRFFVTLPLADAGVT